jgi:energy-coupling factor transporter ATP-binding protein EcfA2
MTTMQRTELSIGSLRITGLNNVNVLLGRNGAGKSRFLRTIDGGIANDTSFNVRYISPERAGVFRRDGNIQNNIERNPQWLRDVRRVNQAENFKAASANLLREIETIYLRRLQDVPHIRADSQRNFRNDRLDSINRLLLNLTIEQERSDFVFRSSAGETVPPDQVSSGESEAIALAAEIMYFFDTVDEGRFNVLLLDEPDVHLHPDLQARLASFIVGQLEAVREDLRPKIAVILATHSTSLVCALAKSEMSSIGTKDFGVDSVNFSALSQQLKKVAPFFGHPLSLSLSNDVMLILEGEDDERVWQQAARTSQGRIRLFPVLATSVDVQSDLERFCAPLLNSLYDSPVAYSLRDGDGVTGDLPAIGPVIRFRLNCYAIENLLVTDECLSVLRTTWPAFQRATTTWLEANAAHTDASLLSRLVQSEDRLRNAKIKPIRQLVCAIAGANKPWEVVVGQAIGSVNAANISTEAMGLPNFIGLPAITALLNTSHPQDAAGRT